MSYTFKLLRFAPSLMIVVGLAFLSSCGSDEKPKSGISFALENDAVFETDDPIEITLNLSKAVSETVVLSYTLSGTADEYKTSTDEGDFEISPTGGYITIGPGATTASIEVTPYEDYDLEIDDEGHTYDSLIITLTGVVSGPAKLGEQTTFVLYILEDDMLMLLDWNASNGTADMDLLLWVEDPAGSGDYTLLANSNSTQNSADHDYEGIYLISGFPDRKYGVSYTYYDGTSDNVALTSEFINFGGSLNGDDNGVLDFTTTYTLDNLNNYGSKDSEAPDVVIAQYMNKIGRDFTGITDITIPGGVGSRVKKPARIKNQDLLARIKNAKFVAAPGTIVRKK